MNTDAVSPVHAHAEHLPHPSPDRHRVGAWANWFGLVGAPLAWSLQEAVNVSLAGYACYPHDVPLSMPMWPHLVGIAGWVELVAIVVCVAAWFAAFSSWQRSRDEKPGDAHQLIGSGDGRTRFMAMAGMMTSVLFLIATSFATLNLAGVPPCGG